MSRQPLKRAKKLLARIEHNTPPAGSYEESILKKLNEEYGELNVRVSRQPHHKPYVGGAGCPSSHPWDGFVCTGANVRRRMIRWIAKTFFHDGIAIVVPTVD